MTTRNLQGLDALADAVRIVAESARNRVSELEREIAAERQQHGRSLEDVDVARRALEQQHNDRTGVFDEEMGQLAYILTGTRPSETPAQPDETPEQPAESQAVTPPATSAEEQPATPTGRHTVRLHVTDEAAVAEPERRETSLAWVFALIAGLVMFILMIIFYGRLLGLAQGDLGWVTNGFVRFIFVVVPAYIVGHVTWIFCKRKNL